MNNLQHVCNDPEYLLREWGELDAVIHHSEELLERLRLRCSEVEAAIDEITRPFDAATPTEDSAAVEVSAIGGNHDQSNASSEKPRFIPRGFDYRGKPFNAIDKIDIHEGLLRRLLEDFPDKADAMLRALHSIGRTRKYLTRDRSALFSNKSPEWVLKHSKALGDGWYMDTNLSESMMRRILKDAAQAAGLVWGRDVVVRWRSRWIQPGTNPTGQLM